MNVHIVQVLSSCERIIKNVKKCRASGKKFWEKLEKVQLSLFNWV